MDPIVRSVRLGTGVRLPYVERGHPMGLPVVMLHGVTDSWRSFEPVLAHLPGTIRAFAVTQRGHGDADRPAGGYRTRDFAADVAAFADALGLDRVVVVGHSMGATNALRFAIDFPDRVLGLVLAGSFARYRGNAGLAAFWEDDVSRLSDPIAADFARAFQEGTLAQPIPKAFLDTAVAESLKVPAAVWREAFAGFFEDDFAAELDRVNAPALLIWGDRDGLVRRADQDAQLAALRDASLVAYEGAGHAVHWEEPARFAADVAAFARRVASSAERVRRGARARSRSTRPAAA